MDKKDIYEHLANIYLDASSTKTKKMKVHPYTFKNMFFASAALVICLSAALYFSFQKPNPFGTEAALALTTSPLKLNFNFDPAKKETYALELNRLDLSKFSALGFALKKSEFSDKINLKVEFTNGFGEISEVYINDVGHKWQEHRLSFAQFGRINDWSRMRELKFIVEDWNTKNKTGIVYIDNVRVIK
jgi:hypothetical protein